MPASPTDPPSPASPIRPRLPLLWFVPLFMVTAAIAACTVFVSARALSLQWDTSQPEGAIAYNALQFAATGRMYPALQEPPYTPVPYPPAYYLVLALRARINPNIDTVLRFGRVISFLCFIFMAVIVYRWSRTKGVGFLFAITGAAFVLSQPDAFPWSASARPDMLAILLSLAGLYLLSRHTTVSGAAISGFFLSIAILTKQSAVAAPVAAALWLLAEKRFRVLGVLAASALVSVLACLAVLYARGEHLWSNLSYLADAGLNLEGAHRLLLGQFGSVSSRLPLLTLAVVGAAYALFKHDRRITLPALYFVVSWFVVLWAIRHTGSNNYYFVEAWTASALVAAFGLARLQEWTKTRWAVLVLFAAATLPMALQANQAMRLLGNDGLIRSHGLAGAVRNAYVLTDISYLAAQSRRPEMLDSYFTSILEVNRVWRPVPIINNLSSQVYDLVLLATNNAGMRRDRGYGFFSPAISWQMARNYKFFCAIQVNDGLGQLGYETINVAVPKGRGLTNAILQALGQAGCTEGAKPPRPPGVKTFSFILQLSGTH
jgi:hypothetical protein